MQGTVSAEAQAVGEARADACGATAYVNLESGDCHGDDSAVRSLLQSGVSRVVIGELLQSMWATSLTFLLSLAAAATK